MNTPQPTIRAVDAHVQRVAALLPFPVQLDADMGGTFTLQIDLGRRGGVDDPHDTAGIDPEDPRWWIDIEGGHKTLVSDFADDADPAAVASWIAHTALKEQCPAAVSGPEQFAGGTIARVMGTYGVVHQPMSMYGLGLYGTEGSLVARFGDYVGGDMRVVFDRIPGQRELRLEFEPETNGAYGHGQTLIKMLRHLEACIEGREEPTPSVVDGAQTILVGDAVWRSIRSGGNLVEVEAL